MKIIKKMSCLLVFLSSLLLVADDFIVVEKGEAVAGIEVGSDVPACHNAAQLIVKYVQLSTGAQLPERSQGSRIVLKIEQGDLDMEGFRVRFLPEQVMEITGGGSNGIHFAALDFCERYLGVRFLFPGDLGEYIPRLERLLIEKKEFADAPKFLTRYLTSANPHASRRLYQDWTPFLRGVRPYRLVEGHSLSYMFNVKKYAESNPEFYPIIKGKRYIPPPNVNVHWQPCLSNPGVIKEAVKIICDAFAANPEKRAWSLGMTDGDGFCECDHCRKYWPNPDRNNRFGPSDRSLYYLTFCNAVAAQVAEKYPDAVLAFFAYGHSSDAPENITVHPNLVPVITYDRHNWIDPERKALDLQRHDQWAAIGARNFCWYDYFMSSRYLLPRVYCHLIADILRTGYARGVRHFVAEYFPLGVCGDTAFGRTWDDGPVAYMTYKLLWNPEQDENKVLDEWYRAAVGEEAAPFLRNYFELLERFWTQEAQKSSWFARCARTYLVWTWHDYLDAFDPDILNRCEENLNRACEVAIHKERAEYFRKNFLERKNLIEFWFHNQAVKDYDASAFTRDFLTDDFNQGNSGWGIWKYGAAAGEGVYDAQGGKEDSGALRLDFGNEAKSRNSTVGFEKSYAVEPGQKFEVSVWFRNEDTESSALPYLAIEWLDAEGKEALKDSSVYCRDIHGNSSREWSKLVCKVAAPNLACRIQVRLLACRSQKGRVFFDDLVIKADR